MDFGGSLDRWLQAPYDEPDVCETCDGDGCRYCEPDYEAMAERADYIDQERWP